MFLITCEFVQTKLVMQSALANKQRHLRLLVVVDDEGVPLPIFARDANTLVDESLHVHMFRTSLRTVHEDVQTFQCS